MPALLLLVSLLMGCDPLAPYDPTPVAIVITSPPTATVPPTATPTPTLTPTLPPTATPELLPTPTLFPCDEQTGQVIEFDDNLSAIADENLRFRVYVPPCYFSTQRRFPLVILLHGLSYREEQWEDLGMLDALDAGILAGELPPMLLVMPYLGSIGQFNQFPPDPSYERVILEELLPQVERNFCVWSRPAYRAIAGISRGGFWAYSIALRHPDIFGVAAAHSGYFPNDTGEIPPPFNPLELALNSPALQEAGLRLYLDNGAGDSAGPSVQLLSSRLTQRSIQHTYVVNPTGEHDNTYWGSQVREYLAFYGRTWSRDYNALPSCAEPA
ncbi:MAG: esterase family protein [Anaerolineae bacterium]|nr:esterase family protein [Anaerolineae bacterium]